MQRKSADSMRSCTNTRERICTGPHEVSPYLGQRYYTTYTATVFQAEVLAITEALKMTEGLSLIAGYSDSESAVKAVTRPEKLDPLI